MTERPFDDTCPIGRAAQVFGDACTLMILRDLFRDGTCRFQDFDAQRRGFSPNTVSVRLKSLVDRGYVQTALYQDHPPRYRYSLTDQGHALGPVMTAMYNWAGGTPDYLPPSQRSLT